MRIMVDFPAPLGPKKPTTSPFLMEKEMSSRANCGPKLLLMFVTVMDMYLCFGNQKYTFRPMIRRQVPGDCPLPVPFTIFGTAQFSKIRALKDEIAQGTRYFQ